MNSGGILSFERGFARKCNRDLGKAGVPGKVEVMGDHSKAPGHRVVGKVEIDVHPDR